MADVTLPQLGETVTEGTITQWFKKVGDTVAADEPLFEVSTDKVDTEVPSPIAGVVTEIRVAEGDTVEVGAVVAVIGDQGAAPATPRRPRPRPPPKRLRRPRRLRTRPRRRRRRPLRHGGPGSGGRRTRPRAGCSDRAARRHRHAAGARASPRRTGQPRTGA